jgi:hypothetical protein
MRGLVTRALALGILFGSAVIATSSKEVFAAGEDHAVLQADKTFVQAIGKGDKTTLDKLLDTEFTWTDAGGKTKTRAEVLQDVPKAALGDESGLDAKQLFYEQVGAVMVERGKVNVLRVWVKRPNGWRALVYHEVALQDQPRTAGGTGVKECENPCKTLPYNPKTDAERAIVASWQALETGVTAHDAAAWAPHIADEFVMLGSSNDHPLSKADRMATLNLQKQTGVASAPAPLVSAKMYEFGGAVVMTCLHQPYTGKPIHVSRVWIKRDGQWVMAISYQTTIQDAPAKQS